MGGPVTGPGVAPGAFPFSTVGAALNNGGLAPATERVWPAPAVTDSNDTARLAPEVRTLATTPVRPAVPSALLSATCTLLAVAPPERSVFSTTLVAGAPLSETWNVN